MNILVHTISGIETTIHVCNYLTQSAHTTIQDYIQKSDIMDKLQNTQSILYYIKHYNHEIMEDPCHPIVVATHSVIDIVQSVRNDLSNMKTITHDHKNKWFNYLYSPDYTQLCKTLETHTLIHDLRVKRLMNIMPLYGQMKSLNATKPIALVLKNTEPKHFTRRHSWS